MSSAYNGWKAQVEMLHKIERVRRAAHALHVARCHQPAEVALLRFEDGLALGVGECRHVKCLQALQQRAPATMCFRSAAQQPDASVHAAKHRLAALPRERQLVGQRGQHADAADNEDEPA